MDQSPGVTSPLSHPPTIELLQCADCSSDDPEWASINRGVLLCSECCAVHRNLGRHVSQVRSLTKGVWDTPQLELVNRLHRSGSNRVWEHALLDPASSSKFKKKPSPNDPVVPTKESFIKLKYAEQAFTLKPSKEDDPVNSDDLNKQLWSCVRTSHVDTTLRLLALGADPNYADPQSGNTSLHVAAKEGQAMQVELLYLYGADPNSLNANEQTPSVVAALESHAELSSRLEELRFEITNRMSQFLCGRKPNHQHNQHFLIPELTGKSAMDGLRITRRQLQNTTDAQFEKMAQDVYDEVDRRETQSAWAAQPPGKSILSGNEQCVAVFLPLNPSFSATRNQLRQKLAKYDVREFATLIIDVLKESKRRYLGEPVEEEQMDMTDSSHGLQIASRSSMNHNDSNREYDEVADYMTRNNNVRSSGATRSSGNKTRSSDSLDVANDSRVSIDDVLELRERLTESETKLRHLTTTNQQILKMLSSLQSSMGNVLADNASLKNEVARLYDQLTLARRLPSPAMGTTQPANGFDRASVERERGHTPLARPQMQGDMLDNRGGRRHGSVSGPSFHRTIPSGRMSADHHRDRDREEIRDMERNRVRDSSREKRAREMTTHEDDYATVSPVSSPPSKIQEVFSDSDFPDSLVRETEKLTVAIRQLLLDAQHKQLMGKAADHAHKIASLINQIIILIPDEQRHGKIEHTISTVKDATVILSAKCNAPVLDTEETCHAAYSVAQGAKMLLMMFHN